MITIISRNIVREDCREEFVRAALGLVEASRAEEGNVSYRLCEDMADPCTLCFVEVWRGEEAVAAHNASPHLRDWLERRGAFVESGELHRYTDVER